MRYKLKKIRIDKGYTQEKLARKLDISRTAYTKIEIGIRNPSLNVAMRIKSVLDYSNDNIFLNSNEPNGNNN